MKVKIDYEITGCNDCPYLRKGTDFGNDGRTVYICSKGAYGGFGKGDFGTDSGPYRIPKVPPYKCPYFKCSGLDRVASNLDIDSKELDRVLKEENCYIVSKGDSVEMP